MKKITDDSIVISIATLFKSDKDDKEYTQEDILRICRHFHRLGQQEAIKSERLRLAHEYCLIRAGLVNSSVDISALVEKGVSYADALIAELQKPKQ